MLVIFRSGCVDKLDNCKDYGPAACTTYKPWAEDNCMNTCKFCVGKFYWFIFFSFLILKDVKINGGNMTHVCRI